MTPRCMVIGCPRPRAPGGMLCRSCRDYAHEIVPDLSHDYALARRRGHLWGQAVALCKIADALAPTISNRWWEAA